jgi:hypothetical protein
VKLDAEASRGFRNWHRSRGDVFLGVSLTPSKAPHVYDHVSIRWKKDTWYFEVAPKLILDVSGSMQYRFDRPFRASGQCSYRDLPNFDQRAGATR